MSTKTKFYCNLEITDCLEVYQSENDLCVVISNILDINDNTEVILNNEDCKRLIFELQQIENKLV